MRVYKQSKRRGKPVENKRIAPEYPDADKGGKPSTQKNEDKNITK